MAAPRRSVSSEEAELLDLLLDDGLMAFLHGDESDEDESENEFEDEFEDDEFYDDDEDDRWPRPEWLPQDCANPCLALDLGTCCKDPANPMVRRAVGIADAVDRVLERLDHGECAQAASVLGRLLGSVPGLRAQVHAVLPGMDATAVAQLLCPVGRLTTALAQVCHVGCPWACGDPDVPDRRAEFEPLRSLLRECSAALWARVKGGSADRLRR
jgi:hypothetical protein